MSPVVPNPMKNLGGLREANAATSKQQQQQHQQQNLALALLGLKTPESSPSQATFPNLVDLMASAPPMNLNGAAPYDGTRARVREQLHILLQNQPERQGGLPTPTGHAASSQPVSTPFASQASGSNRPVVMSVKPPPATIEPKPKNSGTAGALAQDHRPGCNCRRSKCLKLYCVCFAAKQVCQSSCNCQMCHNSRDHEAERQKAIHSILERNPTAFDAKFAANGEARNVDASAHPSVRHKRGCRCRKSGCLKKYCECFQAQVACGERCTCIDCKNVGAASAPGTGAGAPARSGSVAAPHSRPQPVPLAPADTAASGNSWPQAGASLGVSGVRCERGAPQGVSNHRKRARNSNHAQKKPLNRSQKSVKGEWSPSDNAMQMDATPQMRSTSAPLFSTKADNPSSYSIIDAAEDLAFLKAGTPSPRKVTRSLTTDVASSQIEKHVDAYSVKESANDLSNLLALSSAATSVATSPVNETFHGLGGESRSSPLSTLLAAETELSGMNLDTLRGSPSLPINPDARAFFPPVPVKGSQADGAPKPARRSPYESWRQDGEEAMSGFQIEEGEGYFALMSLAGKTEMNTPGTLESTGCTASKRPLGEVPDSVPQAGKRAKSDSFGQDETEGSGSTDGSASSESGDEVANAHLKQQSPAEATPPLQIVHEHV